MGLIQWIFSGYCPESQWTCASQDVVKVRTDWKKSVYHAVLQSLFVNSQYGTLLCLGQGAVAIMFQQKSRGPDARKAALAGAAWLRGGLTVERAGWRIAGGGGCRKGGRLSSTNSGSRTGYQIGTVCPSHRL